MTALTLYGLTNCDTCRKARKWLAAHDISHEFVDYRAAPVDAATLTNWAATVGGWEKLVNRSSTTWRGLPDAAKAPADGAAWLALVMDHPTLVRRPVVVDAAGDVHVGFSESAWASRYA